MKLSMSHATPSPCCRAVHACRAIKISNYMNDPCATNIFTNILLSTIWLRLEIKISISTDN